MSKKHWPDTSNLAPWIAFCGGITITAGMPAGAGDTNRIDKVIQQYYIAGNCISGVKVQAVSGFSS